MARSHSNTTQMILLPSRTTRCACLCINASSAQRIACCSYKINTFTPHAILKLVAKFYCSVINVITVACKGNSCANFLPLFRSSSIFLFLRLHINLRCKGRIRCCFTRRVVFPYLLSHANVCSHTSPCLPVKHNTSFSCFLLRTTVDCCFYTPQKGDTISVYKRTQRPTDTYSMPFISIVGVCNWLFTIDPHDS